VSVFTPAELEYLQGARLARLATAGADNQPHIVPITYVYNAEEDTIDIGGINFAKTKKWRDAQHNPRVAFLLDESAGSRARAIEVRGIAEVHTTGGGTINPRFPNFVPEFLRIRPQRIVSWGLGESEGWHPNARDVSPRD
jgi:pyridoxamine 5'-phosphate oxidase family protein